MVSHYCSRLVVCCFETYWERMNTGVVFGHVAGGDDSILVKSIHRGQLLDRVSVATQYQNPLILVLLDKHLEGGMRLDKLVFLNLHGKSMPNALSVTSLGQTTAIGEEDEGDRVHLKSLQGLLCSRDGFFSSDKDTVDVKRKGKVTRDILEVRDDACLGLFVVLQREPLKMEFIRREALVMRVTVRHSRNWFGLFRRDE